MVTVDQLRKYPLFADLQDAQLARVAQLVSRRVFSRSTYIFYPGSAGHTTYLVESGLVRLFFSAPSGQELLVNLVGPLEVFGLPLLQENQVRVLGAVAHQPTVVLSIGRDDLFRLMEESPQFMRNVYLDLSTSSRRLLLYTRMLATLDLKGRLATMLLRLASKDSTREDIDLPISQETFAGWLGASRGRLNRALNQLRQIGLITFDRQRIVIVDRAGLERLSEGFAAEDL